MSDAFVQVAPDDPTGKKIQTYEGTVSGQDVHAQAVVIVNSSLVPYVPVVGPALATDGHLAVFDGTSGSLIKDGGAIPSTGGPINADAPNSTIAVNVLTASAATIISKSITYAAGDQVTIRIWGAVLNNTIAGRTYSLIFSLGTLTATLLDNTVVANSSTSRSARYIEVTFSVASTSSAWLLARQLGIPATALGTFGVINAGYNLMINQHSSSNLTGAQTTSVQMFSDTTATVQSFELHAWTIEKISTNP